MPHNPTFTLRKRERIAGRRLTEKLFGGGARSISAFPVRAVYMLMDSAEGDARVRLMVSVSKRHFKRAVRRNRAKRQMREAFRLNKGPLAEAVAAKGNGQTLAVALIWLADKPMDTKTVAASVATLMGRMAEKMGGQ